MANILDAAPVNRTVTTHKYGTVEVTGLSMEGLVALLKQHPEIIDMLKGQQAAIAFGDLLDLGVEVVASFLAAGLGHPGNADAIARCKGMNAEDVWLLGNAIVEESFPGGAANFIERVTKALGENSLVSLKAA